MNSEHEQDSPTMSAERLIRAADVLLAARARGGQSEAFVDAWLGKETPKHSADSPFTYSELVEAMCFLMRCGLVDVSAPESASGGAQRPRIEKK